MNQYEKNILVQDIFSSGKKKRLNNICFFFKKHDEFLLIIRISKKFGCASKRNKMRRWLKEIFRKEKHLLKNTSILIIVNQPFNNKKEVENTYFNIYNNCMFFIKKFIIQT